MLKPTAPTNHLLSTHLLTRANRAEAKTLTERLARHAAERPSAAAVTLIPSGGAAETTLSYAAFWEGAGRYAAALRAVGIGQRDLVILVIDHGEPLLYAFWGALRIGAIPSMFPFLSDKLDAALYFERVKALVSHSGARAVIASPAYAESLSALMAGSGVAILSERDLHPTAGADIALPATAPDQIAFLQHSSGTTGLQKGVALAHDAVLNHLAAYSDTLRLTPDDVIVSWLPLYHDMGLIAGFILPLVQGIPLILMSPHHWVRDPRILLQAITRHRGTLCWLPNFAYNFMATRIRDDALAGVDLQTMRAFVNCSEPMRAESHRLFLNRYRAYGLRPEALTTCYAMAENTFAVTQGGIDSPVRLDRISRAALMESNRALSAQGDEPHAEMLCCGTAIPNCRVRILGSTPEGERRDLPERQVGEVAVQSDSMLSEYYRRPDLTEAVLFDGWYLTGDYGYLAEGGLYITGRKKDLIIVGGKNIYPQDLEALADTIEGVKAGRVVVFGVDDTRLGTEAIVLVAESEIEDEDARFEVARRIRLRVAAETEVTLNDVRVVDLKWLHKTSSGKIARGANREKYLAEFGTR
ncbi:MAG TPA: AMP-binding protein [Aggregatilineales bacterium]|nr:AMP-binding protein [Anaerolineales bacterium]HRE49528.1 AMP-binding protein [Aggregatilineales bacterium]